MRIRLSGAMTAPGREDGTGRGHGLQASAALLSLLCAALALYVASTSSPRYATNFWTDTNIYFTIGRGMTQGLMPYRDLFDHKGPVLFMLYALGALISDTSYLGVYLLEVLSLALTLYFVFRTAGGGFMSLPAIPVSALITVTCTAFNQGGSAEEFCLPALACALFLMMDRFFGCIPEERARIGWRYLLLGASAAWVLAIKYTDLGLFFGIGAGMLLFELRVCGVRQAAKALGFAVLGALLVLAPVAAYLAAYGVLGDCLNVYFYQNIFGYGGASMSLAGHVYNALAYLRTQSAANPVLAVLAVLGFVVCALEALFMRPMGAMWRRGFLIRALTLPVGAGLLLLFCYWGEIAHPYYALVFAALAAPAFYPLAHLPHGHLRATGICAALAVAAAILPACRSLCAAEPLAAVRREDMPQTAFAAIINESENPTLLDLTSHDQGFYLAAGVTPIHRYFADNNLDTQEKRDAIAAAIANREAEYIVTVWREITEGYELIAEQTGVFDLNDARPYKLYRRIEVQP